MNIGIIFPIMVFVVLGFSGTMLAFSVKKKSETAYKSLLADVAVFAALALVVMIIAIVRKGEPLVGILGGVIACLGGFIGSVIVILQKKGIGKKN